MKKVRYIGEPLESVGEESAPVFKWPRSLIHYHTYGQLLKFFEGLKQGKLFVTYCSNPECFENKSWLPPRADCPDCHQPMEWKELPKPVIGKIYTYTLVERAGTGMELSTPYWQIDVEIPGLTTIPKSYLLYGKPYIGMKVRAGFRTKKPTNTILDLYWVPVKDELKQK